MKRILFVYGIFFLAAALLVRGFFPGYERVEVAETMSVFQDAPAGIEETYDEIILNDQDMEKEPLAVEKVSVRKPIIVDEPVKGVVKESAEKMVRKTIEIAAGIPVEDGGPRETDGADLYDHIYKFVSEWKNAWENTAGRKGETDRYISFYAKDFRSGKFNRESWKLDKLEKGRVKEWVEIRVSDIRISGPDPDNHIEVRFRQDYRSSNYSGVSEKLLILKMEGDQWKIFDERSHGNIASKSQRR